ncbi:MAG: hypothetical protein GY839_17745 [candidate division Zixibacteria bacterium]|nr:hypothetical protein [candidate division Zixibacteria bacterium]
MNFFKSFKQKFKKWRESRYFNRPDIWLAYIKINDELISACIKNDLALLRGVPNPKSGIHFKDVIRIRGPVGTTTFRDEEVPIYEMVELVRSSGIPTYTFKAIIPTLEDFFRLGFSFNSKNESVSFNQRFRDQKYDPQWRDGWCAVENKERLESIFSGFVLENRDCKVKDISLYVKRPAE